MSSPSIAVVDALNSLLEAEANSIFHFVGPGSPYVASADIHVREPLEEFSRHLDRHQRELSELIRKLGGTPAHPPLPDPEDQYLSFLSLKFLLPKLVESKELMIQRHQSVLNMIQADPEVMQLLQRHTDEMQSDLTILKRVADLVAGGTGRPT